MGGVLKRRLENLENGFANFGTTFKEESSLVKNIKGKTLGKTFSAQAEMPDSEAEIYFVGFDSMHNKKNITRIESKIGANEDLFCAIFFFNTFSKFV